MIATDVSTGFERVLTHGSLVDAVTASAAIPGVFRPVRIGDSVYMDGGVANNTPLCHPVEQGFDRVLVLPCGSPCALARAPHSALGVVLQALAVLVQQRLWHDVQLYQDRCELLVIPPLCPLSVAAVDFSHTRELIDRGYVNTRSWLDSGLPPNSPTLVPHSHDGLAASR